MRFAPEGLRNQPRPGGAATRHLSTRADNVQNEHNLTFWRLICFQNFTRCACARMRTHTASRNPVFMPVLRLNIIPPRERSRAARAHVVETENHPLSPFDRPVGGARRRLKTTQAAAGGLRNYGRPFCPGFLMVRPNCICPVCTDPPCPPSLFLYTPQASFFSF